MGQNYPIFSVALSVIVQQPLTHFPEQYSCLEHYSATTINPMS